MKDLAMAVVLGMRKVSKKSNRYDKFLNFDQQNFTE